MIPVSMKKPLWLAPCCIVSLTLGIFLALVVTTGLYPELKDRADRRGGTGFLLMVGISNVTFPIAALWWHTRAYERHAPGAPDDDTEL
jgi:hypothetical protein